MSNSDQERRLDVEKTVRENARQDELALERLEARGVKSARDAWMLEQAETSDDPVASLPPTAYALPSHARKILPPELLSDLQELLNDLKGLNEAMVGLPSSVANVALAEDQETSEVRARFRRWAEGYAGTRLAKRSARDNGDPVQKFKRLYYELLPALEAIATADKSAHYAYMGELLDYVPWLIFQGTWGSWLEFDTFGGPLEHRWRVAAPTLESQEYCQELVRLYAWTGAQDVARAVRVFRLHAGEALSSVPEPVARERLAALAAEIREVRPFVIGGHNPEKCAEEVAEGLWVSWFWGGSQQLGVVPLHDDPRQRVTEFRRRTFSTLLRVDHQGLLASEFTPWIDVDSVAEPDALAVNLAFVEALHAQLLAIFDKVDLDAVYERTRNEAAGDAGHALPSQEALASTFLAADPESPVAETVHPGPGRIPRPRVPTLRLGRFLSILTKLGCEVRQGKGSEVVVYRKTGHIARIGRHTRNRQVPSSLAQRVLHQVGVTLGEWLEALDRR